MAGKFIILLFLLSERAHHSCPRGLWGQQLKNEPPHIRVCRDCRHLIHHRLDEITSDSNAILIMYYRSAFVQNVLIRIRQQAVEGQPNYLT